VARALVEVRRATVEDVAEVLELWTQGREDNIRLGRPSTSAQQAGPRLAEAIAGGQIELLLARRDGRPAGFLILRESPLSFLVDQPAVIIEQLFVTAAARRHGVARAMLSHVASRAERIGAEQIVSTVTPWARDTHRFFARLGFSPLAVWRSVTPATLRRRLSGELHRGGLEDLLSRRRSARARNQPVLAIVEPELGLGPGLEPGLEPALEPGPAGAGMLGVEVAELPGG
jgi:GNAT superfamily N-acetyltransferase